jgi:DNA polymerase III epsilon subunit-like protein
MIAIDVEGSGMSAEHNSILSLGAVDTDNPSNQFYDECRVWDGAHIEDSALAVNGFTRGEITDTSKKSEAELVQAFITWATSDHIKDQTLAGQNPSYDRDFVQAGCHRAGIEFPFAHRTIDVHTLVWLHMQQRGIEPPIANHHSALNLDFALTYCGMPEEPRPHNALTGAYSHAEVISRIVYTKKLLPDFEPYEIPWMNKH